MTKEQAVIGTRVKTNAAWWGVPAGTCGVIDEDYGTGVSVAWDMPPHHPLPKDYKQWEGRPLVATGILRDGFDKYHELHYLEVVPTAP